MKTTLTFIRLAALVGFFACSGRYLSAQNHDNPDCYYLMTFQCNEEASNSPEGGYDQAYDACISWWYDHAKCGPNTPYPTAVSSPLPAQPSRSARPARPVRK